MITGRAAGPRPTCSSRRGRSASGCVRWGTGSSPSSAGPSGATAAPRGTATPCLASTSPGGRGRASSSPSPDVSPRTARRGGSRCAPGTRWRTCWWRRGAWSGCAAACSRPTTPRAAPARPARRPASSRSAPRRCCSRPAGSAGTRSWCARCGPRSSAPCRRASCTGCRRAWTAPGCSPPSGPERAGSTVTACGTTPRGSATGTPSGAGTGSGSCQDRPRCGSTRAATACPPPPIPASTPPAPCAICAPPATTTPGSC